MISPPHCLGGSYSHTVHTAFCTLLRATIRSLTTWRRLQCRKLNVLLSLCTGNYNRVTPIRGFVLQISSSILIFLFFILMPLSPLSPPAFREQNAERLISARQRQTATANHMQNVVYKFFYVWRPIATN